MKKQSIFKIIVIFPLALLICLFALILLVRYYWVIGEEVNRVSSPDSTLDAVTIRTNPGAMSSYVYRIFIIPTGGRPKKRDEVFQGIGVHDIQAKWRGPRLLEISYGKERAEISFFRESWKRERPGLYVEIQKVPHERSDSIHSDGLPN